MECYRVWKDLESGPAHTIDYSTEAAFEAMLRQGSNEEIQQAVLTLFFIRDYKVGLGLRDAFYKLFVVLWRTYPALARELLFKIPKYGSWADIVRLADRWEELTGPCINMMAGQLCVDRVVCALNPENEPSLLAKWAPREGKQYDRLATALARATFGQIGQPRPAKHRHIMMQYRQLLSGFNRRLGTVEVLECAGAWNTIDPAAVTLKARQIKWRAYLNIPAREDDTEAVRRSADFRREICRSNFLSFHALQEMKEPFAECKYPIDSAEDLLAAVANPRFDSLRATVKDWIEGGWRGVM